MKPRAERGRWAVMDGEAGQGGGWIITVCIKCELGWTWLCAVHWASPLRCPIAPRGHQSSSRGSGHAPLGSLNNTRKVEKPVWAGPGLRATWADPKLPGSALPCARSTSPCRMLLASRASPVSLLVALLSPWIDHVCAALVSFPGGDDFLRLTLSCDPWTHSGWAGALWPWGGTGSLILPVSASSALQTLPVSSHIRPVLITSCPASTSHPQPDASSRSCCN